MPIYTARMSNRMSNRKNGNFILSIKGREVLRHRSYGSSPALLALFSPNCYTLREWPTLKARLQDSRPLVRCVVRL
jgi:hypothetical protein